MYAWLTHNLLQFNTTALPQILPFEVFIDIVWNVLNLFYSITEVIVEGGAIVDCIAT